ncbi:MAG TPA: protein translocase subunit SecF [Steroidobacteraceae bacterium]|nr:protein translocase subunit SecF [Steroidobacteraceae bacterium]
MEFFHRVTNFPFMSLRKIWYAISAVLVIGSLVSLAWRGLNYGVDFTGGITVQATFPTTANLDAIRTGLEGLGYKDAPVQNFGSSRNVSFRLPANDKVSSDQIRAQMTKLLQGIDAGAEVQQIEVIGPQIGSELRTGAIESLFATLLLIFVYVAIRFHTWRLSLGAIFAALHDPIIVLGFFSFTQITFDLTVVAATLAVIGYSLNDTIVVFDRIRERFHAARRLPPQEVMDQSINQTLSRTVITSGATFLVVLMLFVFGGPVLLGFSTALMVGILVGTYSSIYIAGAAALDMGLKAEHLLPTAVKHPIDDLP